MTEKELMLNGDMYDPSDPQLVAERTKARLLFYKINNIDEASKEQRDALFYDLLGKAGSGLYIEPPFRCDYGYNIEVGEDVFMNFNTCILDVCKVTLGDRVMFGPNVSIFTATHPLNAQKRYSGREFGKPITIGNEVWIGGNVVVNPGVTIGDRVVVGSGSVVVKDIPSDSFYAGNPAKFIKKIDK